MNTKNLRNFSYDFNRLVEQNKNQIAILKRDSDFQLTYNDLDNFINKTVTLFYQKGLKPGDSIISILPNSPEKMVLFLATIKGGFGFAPLTCESTSGEVNRWKKLINPKIIFTCSLTKDEILESLKNDKSQNYLEIDQKFSWLPDSKEYEEKPNAKLYLSTSGTTGEPKAMVIDSNKLWSSGCSFLEYHGLQNQKLRFWNYLPMSYLGGLFNLGLIPLASGGSFVIDAPFSGQTFLGFWQNVERYDINSLWLVPTITRGLLTLALRTKRNEFKNYSSIIKTCFLGTAPIDLGTKKKFEETFGITMLENFGLSETTFLTSENLKNISNRKDGTVGEKLPYIELELEKQDHDSFEIKVKSPFLFDGYLNSNGKIETPTDQKGYFATGDYGKLENDQLILTGRKRDIIKKGGHFIALLEIESLINQCPEILESAAVKINHDFYGEAFNLHVVLKNNTDESLNIVTKYVQDNLVKYKWPEKILKILELPKTASGKIQKHLIKG